MTHSPETATFSAAAEAGGKLRAAQRAVEGGFRRHCFYNHSEVMPDDDSSVYELLSERNNIVVIADEAHAPSTALTRSSAI
jgi:type I site-specific restriction-modification system R (restriction) subunit